jgi:hypothetical protein
VWYISLKKMLYHRYKLKRISSLLITRINARVHTFMLDLLATRIRQAPMCGEHSDRTGRFSVMNDRDEYNARAPLIVLLPSCDVLCMRPRVTHHGSFHSSLLSNLKIYSYIQLEWLIVCTATEYNAQHSECHACVIASMV